MTDSGLAVAVTLCASELCYSVGNFSPPLTRLRAWATRARLGHHSALPPYQATTPSMLGSRALGPVPSGARPLIAVASRGGTIAATSCGRVVHLLQHAQVLCSWRLPAPVRSLQWWPDGTAVLAITQAGCSWRLTAEVLPSENGDAEDSREMKRRRTEPEGRHVVRPVGSANRVQISQLSPDFVPAFPQPPRQSSPLLLLPQQSAAQQSVF